MWSAYNTGGWLDFSVGLAQNFWGWLDFYRAGSIFIGIGIGMHGWGHRAPWAIWTDPENRLEIDQPIR
jgi:hypothetical protein